MRLSRRAFLAGGVCSAGLGPARADVLHLEAAALSGGGLGYNGASPGPILRAAVGRPLAAHIVNKLDRPTSLWWPGLRGGFPGLDGAALGPGAARDIAFTPTEPGFQLYGAYGAEASAGLFGALVIDEAAPPACDLDAIVVLSGTEAALRVNGEAAPLALTAPPGGRVRLRLANAAPEMTLTLKASGAEVHIFAIDGQPSELFEPLGAQFPLCPSARFELMFDLSDGAVELAAAGGSVIRVEPKGERVAAKPPVAALPANPRLPREIALERAQRVAVTLAGDGEEGFTINGVSGKDWPSTPLFKARRGTPVALTLVNRTGSTQTLRLAGHVARQLHGLDDGWDPYWRDALPIGPGRTVHAAFIADAPGKWPLASASPASRAKGLAAWFQVG